MTRFQITASSGPRLRGGPVSLEQQLEAAVAYEAEKQRQAREWWLKRNCLPPETLPRAEVLEAIHFALARVCGR